MKYGTNISSRLRRKIPSRIISALLLCAVWLCVIAPALAAEFGSDTEPVAAAHGFSSPVADMFNHLLTDAPLRSGVIGPRVVTPDRPRASSRGVEVVWSEAVSSAAVNPVFGSDDFRRRFVPPAPFLAPGTHSQLQPLGP